MRTAEEEREHVAKQNAARAEAAAAQAAREARLIAAKAPANQAEQNAVAPAVEAELAVEETIEQAEPPAKLGTLTETGEEVQESDGV
jgi:hypothetical protein